MTQDLEQLARKRLGRTCATMRTISQTGSTMAEAHLLLVLLLHHPEPRKYQDLVAETGISHSALRDHRRRLGELIRVAPREPAPGLPVSLGLTNAGVLFARRIAKPAAS